MKPTSRSAFRNPFLSSALFATAAVLPTPSVQADTASITLSPVADTRVISDSWGADTNFGNDGEMGIYNSRDRSLLQFVVPVGATINSANLSVTVTGTYGGNPESQSMDVYRLTGSWAETGVTWNTQPGYEGTIQASSTANPGIGQSITWDVTSLANQWASGSVANNGLIIINNGTNNGLHFATKENSNASYRPTLTTAFTTPTSAPLAGWSWSGGTGNWSDADEWLNGVTPVTWANNTDAVFGHGSDAAGTVTISGTVTPRTLWFQNTGSGNYTISGGTIDFGGAMRIVDTAIDATISSTLTNGALFKQGSGKLTLTGSLGYKGGTVVSSGTLAMPEGDWHTGNPWDGNGATGAITVSSGATLSTSSGVAGIKNGLTLNGGTVSSRGLTYDGSWGNLFLLSNITAGGTATSTITSQINLSGNRTITVDTGSTLNVTGKLNAWNSSGAGITKEGTGTLALSGANGFTGVTDITAGTLLATNSSALGESGWSGDNMTWVRDGATLALQGNVSINDHMHVFGAGVGGLGAIRSLSGDNLLTMTNGNSGSGPGFSIDSTTTIGVDAGSLTVTGFYETGGSFGITKVGAGTLALTQPSTYTGNTLITGGKIALGNASALQNSAFDTASVNGGLDVTGYATPTLGGLTGSVNLSPTLITGYGSVTGLTLNPQAGITQTYSGVISNGSDAMTLTKSGAGTQELSGNNNFSSTTVNGGTLAFTDGTSTIGDITNSFSALVFSGSSAVTGGTLHFQGAYPNPQLTISDNADVTLTGGITHQPSVGGDPYHAANYTFSGGILRTPSISGPSIEWNQAEASMHFDGTRIVATADNADFITTIGWDHTNTINLRSTNGAIFDTAGFDVGIQVVLQDESGHNGKLTKLGAGTLSLSNSSTYTGTTTVSAGTLLVNGSLGDTAVTVSADATIGGSGSIAGSLNFGAGANLTVNLADPLDITGAVTFDGFDFTDIVGWDYALAENGIYTLLKGSSIVLDNVAHVGRDNALNLGDGRSAYFQQGSLQVVVIPEPHAALLGGLGLLALLRRRRA